MLGAGLNPFDDPREKNRKNNSTLNGRRKDPRRAEKEKRDKRKICLVKEQRQSSRKRTEEGKGITITVSYEPVSYTGRLFLDSRDVSGESQAKKKLLFAIVVHSYRSAAKSKRERVQADTAIIALTTGRIVQQQSFTVVLATVASDQCPPELQRWCPE